MNKKFSLLTAALLGAAAALSAEQADVTATYLKNTQFNGPDYTWSIEASGAVNEVAGNVADWTVGALPGYYAYGTAQYGTSVDIKGNGTIPASGYEGSEGGCLVFASAWGANIYTTQDVELPAGSYTLRVPTYNCNKASGTSGTSMLAWLPEGGAEVVSGMTYKLREWQIDEITFTLADTTKGKIRLGVSVPNEGSGSTAKPCLDYVELLREDVGTDALLAALRSTVEEAQALLASEPMAPTALLEKLRSAVSSAEGITADNTAEEISAAQAALSSELAAVRTAAANYAPIAETYGKALATAAENADYKAGLDAIIATAMESAELSADEILAVRKQLIAAQRAFITTGYANVSDLLVNPDFEDGLEGWTNVGFKIQNNNDATVAPYKSGSNYAEKWVAQNQGVGSCSLLQTVALESGDYILVASAQNQRQNAEWAAVNAWLVAGDAQTEVNFINVYSVKFSLAEAAEVELGFKCVDATGNWVSVDNMQLFKIDTSNVEALLAALRTTIDEAQALLASETMAPTALLDKLRIAVSNAEGLTTDNTADEISAAQAALTGEIAAVRTAAANYAPIAETYGKALATAAENADYKADLDAIIATAMDSEELSADEILAVRKELIAAQRAFITTGYANVSDMLVNPDFEDGLEGWTNVGFNIQNNNDATIVAYKSGNNYAEKWVPQNQGVGSCSLLQTVTLGSGDYILVASAQNQRQDADWLATNAWLVAGEAQTEVNVINVYSVKFSLTETTDVELGFKCVDATGNWVSVDNMQLFRQTSTGIDSITAGSDESPVYYNLQGLEVSKPAHGIYIVKRGNKVTKEIIR
ncbi:MAG: hypothetical protein NC418_09650 [Muribaculaceae bacterium]|nr:hypothetical protein [Muribaculaceae bacterium]